MDKKKTLLMFLGVISGMMFIYGLDILTARLPAKLRFDLQHWKILRYHVEARIDNLTVMDRDGRKVPVRYVYREEMELNYYFYHMTRTGRPMVAMELLSKKIVPKSITVGDTDETQRRGTRFAGRTPPPWYLFLGFARDGAIEGQRRAAGIRDMIVSTYYTRRLPKGTSHTRDTWSGEADMGPFITTFGWRFDNLRLDEASEESLAEVSGGGDFLEELPGGGKGSKLGSYTYSYAIGVGLKKGYIRQAKGSFDIRSHQAGAGTSYREEFVQKLVSVEEIPPEARRPLQQQLEVLKEIMELRDSTSAQVFHDSLVSFLRKFPGSPFWDKLFVLLNDLRAKCSEEPLKKEDILKKPEQEKK